MTNPVVTKSPVTYTGYDYDGWLIRYSRTVKSKQKAPYNLPSFYEKSWGVLNPGGNGFVNLGSPNHRADSIPQAYFSSTIQSQLLNMSYERLRSELMASAGLGVDAVEYRQSLNMMTHRLSTTLKAAREIKSLRFGDAAKTLNMAFVPKGVRPRRAWAGNFLEYHFGWEPLIKDIYECAEIIHNPVKTFNMAKGTARDVTRGTWKDNLGSVTNKGSWTAWHSTKCGARIRTISNGNLHTLEQFGVLNPLVLAWEVVPFSFVVDWFANVGDVLRSLTDFAGMTLENQYTLFVLRSFEAGDVHLNPGFPEDPAHPPRIYSAEGLYIARWPVVFGPTLSFKSLRLPSATRAVTASALLTQFLRS